MGVSHQFVQYLLTILRLSIYLKKICDLPEEHFLSTVYMRPDVPGGLYPNLKC